MVFVSKNASQGFLARAMVAEFAKTNNGILMSRIPIEDARLQPLSLAAR